MKITDEAELQVLLEAPESRRRRPGERPVSTVGELIAVLRLLTPETRIHVQSGGPSKGRYLTFDVPKES